MSNTVLFALWGALYALCAGLGFVAMPGPALRLLMIVLSLAMFIPPFLLNKKGNRRVRLLVRNLSLAWLIATAILLPANFLAALAPEMLGNFLHGLLTILSSPLVCSDSWALTIFLWACVFFDARTKLKK
jgi:hypothetical protein